MIFLIYYKIYIYIYIYIWEKRFLGKEVKNTIRETIKQKGGELKEVINGELIVNEELIVKN